ncbi:MAG: formate dehydrogenase accessory sulfurtransferase FdhD, partial [Chloroflexota bacterium]|nr:formate dehydrogenase accessory sulfurtransferase FdhD [Chloroflexota bacterium]
MADAPAAVVHLDVEVVTGGEVARRSDLVTVEEPLEIRLVYGPADHRVVRSVAVTMRTPGDDLALAVGFLHGEGVVRSIEDVSAIDHDEPPDPDKGIRNVVRIELAPTAVFDADILSRNFYTSSSCGVCGKTSIDAVRVKIPDFPRRDTFAIDHEILGALPERLTHRQEMFARTGGLHASGAFDASGQIVTVSEDVGRHNALDKLVGGYLSEGKLPLS